QDLFVTIKSTCSCTVSGCSSILTVVVPSGVHTVTLNLSGAEGGGCYSGVFGTTAEADGNATYGANVQCTYSVTAGNTLYGYGGCVGGTGNSSVAGTSGAGGNGDENGGT